LFEGELREGESPDEPVSLLFSDKQGGIKAKRSLPFIIIHHSKTGAKSKVVSALEIFTSSRRN